MARIAGVDIPRDKRVIVAMTYIYGIGPTTAARVVTTANVNPDTRVKDLSDEEVGRLRSIVDKMASTKDILIEGDLRREVAMNIKRLVEIGSYRGIRHRRGLPVRGQRTRTNGRSRRGPKRTVGVRRKKGK